MRSSKRYPFTLVIFAFLTMPGSGTAGAPSGLPQDESLKGIDFDLPTAKVDGRPVGGSATAALAPTKGLESKFMDARARAEKATQEGDAVTADLWMARYAGLCADPENKLRWGISDLYSLMDRRADLKNYTSIINERFSKGFKRFFIGRAISLWQVPDNNFLPDEKSFKVKPTTDDHGDYFVIPVLKPVFQVWLDMTSHKTVTVPFGKSLLLKAGRILKGDQLDYFADTVVPLGEGSFVQHLWLPEFSDLDGDGVPELWVRYNATIANGFRQVLEIYRFEKGKKLKLLRRFEGDAEGIARRTQEGAVELAQGCTDGGTGHLGFEKHCFERWEYRQGSFVRTKEWKLPNLLWTKAWEPYYDIQP